MDLHTWFAFRRLYESWVAELERDQGWGSSGRGDRRQRGAPISRRAEGAMNEAGRVPSPWRRPPVLRRFEARDGERGATWLELFFDLVFVVAIAALAVFLHDRLTLDGFPRFTLFFMPVG